MKITVYIATSLDGYIARKNGKVDWLPETSDSGYGEFYKSIDTIVMGKTTYDQVLTFGDYPYKDKKSFVITRNPTGKDENVEFVPDIEKIVEKEIPMEENVWLVGGAQIISSFLEKNLIDEFIISVIPVVLGDGIPLFQNIRKETKLELIKTIQYNKLVEMCYRVLKK